MKKKIEQIIRFYFIHIIICFSREIHRNSQVDILF